MAKRLLADGWKILSISIRADLIIGKFDGDRLLRCAACCKAWPGEEKGR